MRRQLAPLQGPYRRQLVTFAARDEVAFASYMNRALRTGSTGCGVHVTRINRGPFSFKARISTRPSRCDVEGYVRYPNVNMVTEMVDMISASRSYEANAAVFNASKSMAVKALELGRR